MITTRRSDGFTTESARGGVDLLEKTSVNDRSTESVESFDEGKALRKRNLDKLLNYDRYAEFEAEKEREEAAAPKAEAVAQKTVCSEDDIRPTKTTTQFIEGDPQIFNDAQRSKEIEKDGYKLNAKGKLIVVLYALVVTVVFALIVLNTGILKTLTSDVDNLSKIYEAKVAAVQEQNAIIEEISSPEHVMQIAENELGMVLR